PAQPSISGQDWLCPSENCTAMEEAIMKLTENAIRQFREQGYVAMPQFYSPREVAALQAEIDRLLREGFLRNVATDGDGKTTPTTLRNVQLCPMSRRSDLFRALPFGLRLSLLGNGVQFGLVGWQALGDQVEGQPLLAG